MTSATERPRPEAAERAEPASYALRLDLAGRDAAGRERDAERLWDLGCRALEERPDALIAHFDGAPPAPADLPGDLASRARREPVAARDWVAEYYAGLEPVRLGTLVVAPTHAPLELRAPQRPLWLDPGSAFGTGHHETTRLALEALERAGAAQRRVLDVGAGSGILAIAADLLGAAAANGIDIDPATVPVARANAALNGSRAAFEAAAFGPESVPAGSVDLLLANIYAEVHTELATAYAAALAPGARAVLTGILWRKRGAVLAALRGAGLSPVDERRDGEWALLEAVRPTRAGAEREA